MALQFAYPDHSWDIAKFKFVPINFWRKPENVKHFLENCKKELNVNTPEDWYKIKKVQLEKIAGNSMQYIFFAEKCYEQKFTVLLF